MGAVFKNESDADILALLAKFPIFQYTEAVLKKFAGFVRLQEVFFPCPKN